MNLKCTRHLDIYVTISELTKEQLKNGKIKVWECLVCGHIVTGPVAPEFCPTCGEKNPYFEVREDNYDLILTWGR